MRFHVLTPAQLQTCIVICTHATPTKYLNTYNSVFFKVSLYSQVVAMLLQRFPSFHIRLIFYSFTVSAVLCNDCVAFPDRFHVYAVFSDFHTICGGLQRLCSVLNFSMYLCVLIFFTQVLWFAAFLLASDMFYLFAMLEQFQCTCNVLQRLCTTASTYLLYVAFLVQ